MRKRYKRWDDQYSGDIRYDEAVNRVRRIKGFYTHLLIYLAVNIMIIVLNVHDLKEGESYFQLKNFLTAICWGLGLLAHGLRVFGIGVVLGRDWEERKIREFMEKEKREKWE